MTKSYFLFSLILLVSLLGACDNKQTVDTSTTKNDKSDSVQISKKIEKPNKMKDQPNKKENFWSVFQKAVADKDKTTLESLYSNDAYVKPYKFGLPEEQEKIAAGSASDITQDPSDPNIYVFTMVFSAEEDRKATGDDSLEDSETIVFLKKDATGNFKIFNINFGS